MGWCAAGVEECDDGNEVNTDACLNDCLNASCGDGHRRNDLQQGDDGFEVCDDGNFREDDACVGQCEAALR